MLVDSQHRLSPVNRMEVSSVIIRDKFGEPLIVATELSDGLIVAEMRGSPAFTELLRNMGFPSSVVSSAANTEKLILP